MKVYLDPRGGSISVATIEVATEDFYQLERFFQSLSLMRTMSLCSHTRIWGNEVTKEYSVIGLNEKLITIDDYDKAMELYLNKVRSARGYNTREPSDYISSGNERWKTDAQDWIAFRDEVMEYALDVQNKYIAQQPVPSINDFIAGFPTITWTYRNEAK